MIRGQTIARNYANPVAVASCLGKKGDGGRERAHFGATLLDIRQRMGKGRREGQKTPETPRSRTRVAGPGIDYRLIQLRAIVCRTGGVHIDRHPGNWTPTLPGLTKNPSPAAEIS